MANKQYTVTTKTAAGFNVIHDFLTSDTSLENIPDRCVTCHNHMDHSAKRGVFLLTEDEANDLLNRDEVASVRLLTSTYLDGELWWFVVLCKAFKLRVCAIPSGSCAA